MTEGAGNKAIQPERPADAPELSAYSREKQRLESAFSLFALYSMAEARMEKCHCA
jgi:hypothetical protein